MGERSNRARTDIPYSRYRVARRPAAWAIMSALLLLATGCINAELLESYSGYRARVGAEWLTYVDADQALSPLDRRARHLLDEAAARVIEEAGK